jgi:hypothetical protein
MMGVVLTFPQRRAVRPPKPKLESPPTLEIADDPPGPPALERALGFEEGTFVAHYQIASRAEFSALIAARRSGPVSFLREIQRCAFMQREPAAAAAPLSEFSAYLYGRNGGGVAGQYAAGHHAAFAVVEPFVERLH